MTDQERAEENEYLRIANDQRRQELELAKIHAEKEVELEGQRLEAIRERRPYIGGLVAGILGLILVAVIAAAIMFHDRTDHAQKDRDQQRQQQIATACIAAGNIWINGNCIPSGKK